MQRATSAVHPGEGVAARRAVFAGLCASLVGVGLARFAYTPLIPALIDAGWFAPADAAYLGAANLAGYVAGALLARQMAAAAAAAPVLRAMMVLATIAFIACAYPLSFLWFFVWRFASGLSGGVLMVLAAPVVLLHVPPSRRGFASGLIFTGVGLGIAASGTLVPILMRAGLVETWYGLGVVSLLLTLLAWGGWPKDTVDAAMPAEVPAAPARRPRHRRPALKALYLEYGLNAVGLVPHMIFLVDFVARGLGQGLDAGGRYWVLFGLGAMVGPLLAGHLADRIGFKRALRLALLAQAVAVAPLAVTAGTGWLVASSLVAGLFVPGVVPLVLGRVQELASPEGHDRTAAWGVATTAFALGQAGAAYGFSFLFATTDGAYPLLFALGAGALLLALALDLWASAGEGR